MKDKFSFFILILIGLSVIASEVLAIPAFARKYNMTCKTCHSPFPYLKAYGDEFAGNGFILKDQDAPRYFVETGDPDLSLIRDFPIAVRIEGFVTYNHSKSEQFDFTGPASLKLLSGGAISQNVSYYVYYILEKGEVGKIEDAFLFFNNLFGSELDFSIGQFQVSDPLFKRELRLTSEDYLIYKYKPGHSNIDLTYDRGIILSYAFSSGTDLIAEVVNGTGIGEKFLNDSFDKDEYKNFAGRLSQSVGEYLRLGAFGYYGKEKTESNEIISPGENEVWITGADATITAEPFELNVQYLHRNDSNPFFGDSRIITDEDEISANGGFAELVFRPAGDDSKWYAVALFNIIDSRLDEYDYRSGTLHFGYLLQRNIRLAGEINYNFDLEYAGVGIGFVTAF
ncbi:MAG: hypothetical protein Kow0098_07100 [Ignavibacteriaceae bacterium]